MDKFDLKPPGLHGSQSWYIDGKQRGSEAYIPRFRELYLTVLVSPDLSNYRIMVELRSPEQESHRQTIHPSPMIFETLFSADPLA